MRKVAALFIFAGLMLLVFGCSKSPDITAPAEEGITLVERPQFVDTRPDDVKLQFTMAAPIGVGLEKKPPKPDDPPDTTSDDPNPNPSHKYAYIVGISDYEGTINDLQFCDDDARDMASMLRGEGFTIKTDIDGSATADNITAGLQWLIDNAQPGDEIAFCYSGHGGKAPGYGSSIISADLYYVTHGYVMSYFNAVNCTKKLATLDACVIGDFHSDAEAGTVIATASTRTDSYDAPDLGNGAWTYYFLEGHEDQGLVYAEDVASYAEDGMEAWAAIYKLRVSPKHTDKYTGMFDI
jgi:hypothetical protein